MWKLGVIVAGIFLISCTPSSPGDSSVLDQMNLSPGLRDRLEDYQTGDPLGVTFPFGSRSGFHRTLWEALARSLGIPWKESAQGIVLVGEGTDEDPQGLPVPLYPVETPQGVRTAYWKISYDQGDLWRLANSYILTIRKTGFFQNLFKTETGQEWTGPESGDMVLLVPDDDILPWLQVRWQRRMPLKAAMRPQQFSYLPREQGDSRGFDYNLLRALSRSLGLGFTILEKPQISDFFTQNGVMPADVSTNPVYTFTPDLLGQVDLYPGSWGITPWRERLMDMVPLYPGRNQLASRPGKSVENLRQLQGHTFAVVKDSFQHKQLQQLEADEKISLRYVFGYEENDLFALLKSGKADHVLEGSLFFAKYLDVVKTMEVSPFGTDLWTVGWGLKKQDRPLKTVLEAFFTQAQADGIFGRYWKLTFGADFQEYMSLVMATGQ